MESSHAFDERAYVRQWAATADARRPERAIVFQRIADLLGTLDPPARTVLELGSGPGTLGAALLGRHAALAYVGVDSSEPMLELAREALAPFGARARLVRADLNTADWAAFAPAPLDAIVSNQALHDLGTAAAVEAAYGRARALLGPGALLVNAELVVPEDRPESGKPGKLSVSRHLELLRALGFADARCEAEHGGYAVLVARMPTP